MNAWARSGGSCAKREVGQRHAAKGLAWPPAEAVFLLDREDLGTSLLCVLASGKMFRQGNRNSLSLLWHIQRYCIMYLQL